MFCKHRRFRISWAWNRGTDEIRLVDTSIKELMESNNHFGKCTSMPAQFENRKGSCRYSVI